MQRSLATAALAALAALAACEPVRADGDRAASAAPAAPAAPAGSAGDDAAGAEAAALAVLRRHCAGCHTGPDAEGDLDFVLDPARLVAGGLALPGDAARSPLALRIAAGEMPPPGVRLRPTPAELAAVRAWIDGLRPAAAFRDEAALARRLAADAAALAPADRAHARWLSLAHLANAGAPAAQLARYRDGVAILLASLSWAPVARPPAAIDPAGTLLRIDLRDLGWTAATWDALRAAYPYGAARPLGVPEALRADWLAATASRPPLYHAILGLPEREAELARRLGADLTGPSVRAGFTTSGVSAHNRVIERFPARHGALWRSHDFRSSVGREDVMAHPLDFTAAGGELIFSLPNGLQGYLLVDAAGRRIDRAPTSIVSDPRRPDRAVENALSCFGCHAAGIVERADQVRAAARELPPAVRRRVEAVYAPPGELARLMAADRARFAAALAALGASPAEPGAEPVTLLALRYEAEVDAPLAAAELGLRPEEMMRRLARAPGQRRALAPLLAAGGRMKREAWERAFPAALAELGAGVPLAAGAVANAGPPPRVWRDAAHRTWVALDGAPLDHARLDHAPLDHARLDHAAAAAACRARGLALPSAAELAAAIAGGLAAALALDAPLWTAGAQLDAANQRRAAAIDPRTGRATSRDAAERLAAACVLP